MRDDERHAGMRRRSRHCEQVGGDTALLRHEVKVLRQQLACACELSCRVGEPRHYRLRFWLRLTVAEAVERLWRRLPDRIYDHLNERHEDYRVRLGRPYRWRERRDREALLKRWPFALTPYELRRLVSALESGACYRDDDDRLHVYDPLDVEAELARIRSEIDED